MSIYESKFYPHEIEEQIEYVKNTLPDVLKSIKESIIEAEKGKDGLTPHIGKNGNWWIGDIDTSVKAKGTDGTNGKDGQNGANGKDGIDGEDGVGISNIEIINDELTIALSTGTIINLGNIKGKDGISGKDGVDGISATHSWDGTILTITSASGTSSSNLKGDAGNTPSITLRYDEKTGNLYYSSDGILVDKEYVASQNLATKDDLSGYYAKEETDSLLVNKLGVWKQGVNYKKGDVVFSSIKGGMFGSNDVTWCIFTCLQDHIASNGTNPWSANGESVWYLDYVTVAGAYADGNGKTIHETYATKEELITAESIAKGRATGYVFDTVSDLDLWLEDESNVSKLVLGDNFYIREVDVPDYWWDGSQKQQLETQKVDLSGYMQTDGFGWWEQNTLPNSISEIIEGYDNIVLSKKYAKNTNISNLVSDIYRIILSDNTEYVASEPISDLNLAYPEGDFICSLYFTLASEGDITITLPESKYIGETPDFKNGETWELSIKNGVVVGGKVV